MPGRPRRAVALLLLVAAAACAPQGVEPRAPSGALAAAGPTVRDTIVVALPQEPDTLYAPGSAVAATAVVRRLLSVGLTERDDRGTLQPVLAERTPSLENGDARLTKGADGRERLAVTFRIREGARFANGDPVTASDVAASWALAQSKELALADTVQARLYDAVDALDERTVEIRYKPGQLDPRFASFCCTIVPRRLYDAAALRKERSPVQAGPYRVKEWLPGVSLTLEADPGFWLGAPKTRTIVLRFIGDPASVLAELRAGRVDVATGDALALDQIPELDRLAAGGGFEARYTPAPVWEHVDLNLRDPRDLSRAHPILGDKRVRQALLHGIDRAALAAQVLYDKVRPVDSFLFGEGFAAPGPGDVVTYPFDRTAAARLLDDAGWRLGADGVRVKAGARLELRLVTTAGNRVREAMAQLIADQLRPLGVRLAVEAVPAAKLFAPRAGGPLSAGTFDLALYAWVQGDDPQTAIYDCAGIPAKENDFGGQNYPGYCNAEFAKAMNDAVLQLAPSARRPFYLQAQKVWTTDLPALPLYQRPTIDVLRTGLAGPRPSSAGTPLTFNAHEWVLTVAAGR